MEISEKFINLAKSYINDYKALLFKSISTMEEVKILFNDIEEIKKDVTEGKLENILEIIETKQLRIKFLQESIINYEKAILDISKLEEKLYEDISKQLGISIEDSKKKILEILSKDM
jgi:predicted  nucleic acid-binding Zn-ribbon protein